MARFSRLHSELCSAILQASPAAMFLYDVNSLHILAANDKALARYGYSRREFHAMTIRDLCPANGPALESSLLIDHDAHSRILWTHVTKPGEPFAVELYAMAFVCGRRRLAILCVVDATNWADTRLKSLVHHQPCNKASGTTFTQQPVDATVAQNRAEMEAIARFAGGVAHELNNITQSIGLACELALEGTLPVPVRSKLLGILQQANRTAGITQGLLAFSRRQMLHPRVVNLNKCIEEALPLLSRSLGLNISMDLRLDEDLPPAYVDPEQLTLVLRILADNARVAMPEGGVLRISACRGAENEPERAARDCSGKPKSGIAGEPELSQWVVLSISDSGIGMDETTRRRIFEPFFSTRKSAQTAGLGLATVHGIIHQSNGRIECDTAQGGGTTFRIYLPIATNAQPAGEPA